MELDHCIDTFAKIINQNTSSTTDFEYTLLKKKKNLSWETPQHHP